VTAWASCWAVIVLRECVRQRRVEAVRQPEKPTSQWPHAESLRKPKAHLGHYLQYRHSGNHLTVRAVTKTCETLPRLDEK